MSPLLFGENHAIAIENNITNDSDFKPYPTTPNLINCKFRCAQAKILQAVDNLKNINSYCRN